MYIIELLKRYFSLETLQGDNMPEDKSGHFVLGLLIGLLSSFFLGIIFSFLIVLGCAAGKEFLDSFDPMHHTVDFYDFLATAIGGSIGITLYLLGSYLLTLIQ